MDFSHVRSSSLVEEERMINSFVIVVGQSRFPCSGPMSFVGKTEGRRLTLKKKCLFLKNLIDESDGGKMNPGQYIFSKFKLWLPGQKDPWTIFLRQPLITSFPI